MRLRRLESFPDRRRELMGQGVSPHPGRPLSDLEQAERAYFDDITSQAKREKYLAERALADADNSVAIRGKSKAGGRAKTYVAVRKFNPGNLAE